MFSDYTLKALAFLAGREKPVSLQRLHASILGFRSQHIQAALERGWVISHPPPRGAKDASTLYSLTDTGNAHIRHLCALSNAIPPLPQ